MVRARVTVGVLVFLLSLGALMASAGPATAATCRSPTSSSVTGGYRVQLWCSGHYVDGFGSTLADANQQALLLHQLDLTWGVNCSGSSVATVTGGFRARLWCSGYYVDGFGSTLTDASIEARELAILRPTRGIDCSGSSVATVTGGFRARLWCSGRYVDGIGNTVTGAAQNARLAASLG